MVMFTFAEIALALSRLWWSYIGVPESLEATHHVTAACGKCVSFSERAGGIRSSGFGPCWWRLDDHYQEDHPHALSGCGRNNPDNRWGGQCSAVLEEFIHHGGLPMAHVRRRCISAGTHVSLSAVQKLALKAWQRRFGISLAVATADFHDEMTWIHFRDLFFMHVRLALQQTSLFGSQIETRFISKSSTTEYPYSKPKRSSINRRKRRDPRHDKNIHNIRGNMAQTQKNPSFY